MKKATKWVIIGISIFITCIIVAIALFNLFIWSIRAENIPGTPEYIFKRTYSEENMIGLSKDEIILEYGEFDREEFLTGMYYLGDNYDNGLPMYCVMKFDGKGICISVELQQQRGG